ncbi:Mysoin-binding motif of peroxisomes-domain-containing protein [Gongronella butleri]|nr:Mysoin-binding motif of peroxisomes-domain-containing protein [Gongronella butleri]
MAEFVVYEDTPIADYLQDIDSGESIVKPVPLQLGIHPSPMGNKDRITVRFYDHIYRVWRRSLVRDTFSISLPASEEAAFEEKFKYLIVTSPLLNENTLSAHTKSSTSAGTSSSSSSSALQPLQYTRSQTLSTRIGTFAVLSGLLIALGLERLLPIKATVTPTTHDTPTAPSSALIAAPTITLSLASSISLFFIFRHLRRSSLRRLFNHALSQLQDLLETCQQLDSKIHRALLTIQEIELVARGYRLSAPLSPISRIEQSSKSRRCARLRAHVAALLRRAFILYEEAIIDMTAHVHKPTLSRLFEMYNIHSIASLSSASLDLHDDDDTASYITLDYLKSLAHLMYAKRRECLLQFLALNVMADIRDTPVKRSTAVWKTITATLSSLGKDSHAFLDGLVAAMNDEFHVPATDIGAQASGSDPPTRQFVHRLAILEQQLRTMGARIYLCNDECRRRVVHEPSSGSADDTDATLDRDRLRKEYLALERDMQQIINEWEAGRHALEELLAPPPSASSSSSTPLSGEEDETLPSPVPSPTITPEGTAPAFVVNSDETPELSSLPLPAKASIFESIADILDDHAPISPTPKKSRAERIQEMKIKREQEAKEKASRTDSASMVHELKNVLDRRTQDLDLE